MPSAGGPVSIVSRSGWAGALYCAALRLGSCGRALSTVPRSHWPAAGGHSLLCRAPAGQLRAGRVPLGHARLADSTPGAGCFPLSAPARRRRDRQARPVPCGGPGPPAPPAGICWAGYANRRPVAQAFGRLPLAAPETALRLPEGRSEPSGLGDVLCNTNPSATPKTGVESARRARPTGAAAQQRSNGKTLPATSSAERGGSRRAEASLAVSATSSAIRTHPPHQKQASSPPGERARREPPRSAG
ncbi:MAG: hypothetical protein KatS3mg081_2365 [Gemmatimonadales bacterium]|nr:MAG: hypothetical protein KatS3mg081_2365 [Gemmatimonadales bacterium]